MKAKFTHWYNALAATLLSLLGFASCSSSSDHEDDMICLYGTPTSSFQVKGNVTDENGAPIQGIKAIIGNTFNDDNTVYRQDSAYTDSKGNYTIDKQYATGAPSPKYLKILLEDVDGEANGGTFANDTIKEEEIKINKTGKGDGAWNVGTFEVTANAKLKKKQ